MWRAPTDNDEKIMAPLWREAGLDSLHEECNQVEIQQITPNKLQVKVSKIASVTGIHSTYTYQIYGTGEIDLTVDVKLDGAFPPLPRVGVFIMLPENLTQFSWYGRGPHENYVDRKTGAAVDVYASTVRDEYVPYIMPQEYGNKTDVRWAALSDDHGHGFLVTGAQLIEVSIHPFTLQNLEQAKHTYELQLRDEVILYIDVAQSGLGSAACGPGVLPKYELKADTYRYTFRMQPIEKISDIAKASKKPFPLA